MVAMAATRTVRVHLPWTAVIVALMLFVCVTPLATAGGFWWVMYLLPALALAAVVLGGTTATASCLSARWLRGRIRVPWDELAQIEFPGQRWAVAVTTSGRRVVLPGVRPPDLPRIVAAAGGRLFLARPVTSGDEPTEADADPLSAGGAASTADASAVNSEAVNSESGAPARSAS